MKWLLIKNDLIKNKAINITLFIFIMFSSILAVLSVVMATQTITSISELYEKAQPPHFLQMHKGEMNQDKIDSFMSEYEGVTHWQTNTLIGVYGDSLTVVGKHDTYDLSDSQLDISLVKQNEEKDLLLNAQHEKVFLEQGEIGIPVLLKDLYGMELGDHILLNSDGVTTEFVIKEFILDSMMNSTMASSTRILLSDQDFDSLVGKVGENEYLIEVYLTDSSEASSFQTAYENAGLPQNGQAITYTILFILSALTDIVTVFILLLVSILLIIVAFICVKYTLMATMEEEVQEIGTMKAIGFSFSDIRDLYMYKYKALALASVISGYLVALLISNVFTKHITTTFGDIGLSPLAILLSILAGGLVYLLITFYCKKVLKKIRKLTVVGALVRGEGFDRKEGKARDGLYKAKKLPVNWVLSLREVFYNFRSWMMIFGVVVIAVLMILIPVNLMNTFESPKFITYMGSSQTDVLIEVDNGEHLEQNYEKVKHLLEQDEAVENYFEYHRVQVQTMDADQERMNLHIDFGENAGGKLQYLTGNAPNGDYEIAISYLNAEKMGKDADDSVLLYVDGEEMEFKISGVYQDVTSGGYTAKSQHQFTNLPAKKYTFTVNVTDEESVEMKTKEWSETIGAGVSVSPMEEFINQTLGGVVHQLKTIVLASVLIGLCLAILITVMFLKLRLAKDFAQIATLKAIGFSEKDLKKQYLIKTGFVSLIGIFIGILLSDLVGEMIVNGALNIAGLGVKKVTLITNPVFEYILCPLLLLTLILLFTAFITGKMKKYHIISIMNE